MTSATHTYGYVYFLFKVCLNYLS